MLQQYFVNSHTIRHFWFIDPTIKVRPIFKMSKVWRAKHLWTIKSSQFVELEQGAVLQSKVFILHGSKKCTRWQVVASLTNCSIEERNKESLIKRRGDLNLRIVCLDDPRELPRHSYVSYSIVRNTIYGRKVAFKNPREILHYRIKGSWSKIFDINRCKDVPGSVSFGFNSWEGDSFEKKVYSLKYPFLYCTREGNVYEYSSCSTLVEGEDLTIGIHLKSIFKTKKPHT